MRETYEIYIHSDGRAVCPYCAGLMRTAGNGEIIQCHDCHRRLARIGAGVASDRVMQYGGGVCDAQGQQNTPRGAATVADAGHEEGERSGSKGA